MSNWIGQANVAVFALDDHAVVCPPNERGLPAADLEIEVRVVERKHRKQFAVEVWRGGMQAGVLGWRGTHERAMEDARLAAVSIAGGVLAAVTLGEEITVTKPATCDLLKLAEEALQRTTKIFGRSKGGD